MREMLADTGSKFFVEVVYQKCIKLQIKLCLVRMHAIVSAPLNDVDDLRASEQSGF